jgi:hypothetical protein
MAVLYSQTTVRPIWQYFIVKQQSGQYGSTSQSNNSQENMAVLYSQTTVRPIWQYFSQTTVRTIWQYVIVKQQSDHYGSTSVIM